MIGPVVKDLLEGAGNLLDEVAAGRTLLRGWLSP